MPKIAVLFPYNIRQSAKKKKKKIDSCLKQFANLIKRLPAAASVI